MQLKPFVLALSLSFVAGPALAQDADPQVTGGAPAARQGNEVKVELIDAGASPQRELRYNVEAPVASAIASEMNTSTNIPAMGMNMAMPAILQTMDIDAKTEGELIHVESIVRKAELGSTQGANPMMVEPMRESVRQMIGSKSVMQITNRGHVKSMTIDGAQDMGMGMGADQISQYVVLPEEAVGVGAKWRTVQDIDSGIKMKVTSTYTLTKVDGNNIEVDVEYTFEGGQQALPDQGMGAAQLEKLDGRGRAKITLNLRTLAQRAESNMRMQMSMNSDFGPMEIEQTVGTKVTPADRADSDN